MTKIDIFSGFLGAGKTTLIKKLIKEAFAGQQVVLIENEFGEIGIDNSQLNSFGFSLSRANLLMSLNSISAQQNPVRQTLFPHLLRRQRANLFY